jgi:MraZ protein
MLLGTHTPKLDEKGRIILPAKFRAELAGGVVLTRGQEHCIYVFSTATFQQQLEKLRTAPLTSKQGREFQRFFLSGASEQEPDSQHRVTIPAVLRDYAGLDRELTVIGAGDRAEIWATEAWNTYYAEREEAFAATEEEVIPGLF